MKSRIILALTLGGACSLLACKSSEFARSPDKRTAQKPVEPPKPKPEPKEEEPRSYALGCDVKDPVSVELKGTTRSRVKVTGEFCPKTLGNLSVLMVVDFSGSMGTTPGRTGNDEPVGNTCGRLRAVQKIVEKLKADAKGNDNIMVGLVSFGDAAKVETPMMPLNDFEAKSLTFSKLCRSDAGATNYKAAFERAEQTLTGAQGNKAVFFISDGLPTRPGDGNTTTEENKAAGLTAAKKLLTNIKDSFLNVVYLKGPTGEDAKAYLETLTGDPNRVKIADNAEQLAEKIVELSIPPVVLDESTVSAEVTANGVSTPLKIAKVAKDPTRPDVWTFESEPFAPTGAAGAAEENVVTVRAKDGMKTEYVASMKLIFTSED